MPIQRVNRAFLRENRPRFNPEADEHRRITEAFSEAVHAGDLGALQSPLCEDVAIVADGGGKASALRDVLRGREAVGRFLIRVLGNLARRGARGAEPSRAEAEAAGEIRWFNGAPGWLPYVDGELVTAMSWSVIETPTSWPSSGRLASARADPREIKGPCDRCVVPTLMTSIFAPDPARGAARSRGGSRSPTSPTRWFVGRWTSTLRSLARTKRGAPAVATATARTSTARTSTLRLPAPPR